MEVDGAHSAVVGGGMMFGEVVAVVVFAWGPKDLELALADTVADPIEAHVNCFGALLLDGVIDNSLSAGVVRLDWSCWLLVAEEF